MTSKQLLASLTVLVASGGAFAQSSDDVQPNEKFVSTKTRAEVIAELKQAQAEGTFIVGGEAFTEQTPVAAKRVRNRADTVDTARSNKAESSSGS